MSYNKQLCYNDLTQNQEGARAWRMTPEWELYTTVVTCIGETGAFSVFARPMRCGLNIVRDLPKDCDKS